jgi:hypothetical protein
MGFKCRKVRLLSIIILSAAVVLTLGSATIAEEDFTQNGLED